MKSKHIALGIFLGAAAVFSIAATPIKNLVLQGAMDAAGYAINNVGGITFQGTGLNQLLQTLGLAGKQVAVAYVESNGNNGTAQLGNSKSPYLTLDAALDALPSTGGEIRLGIGRFNAPSTAKMKDWVAFIGRAIPQVNSGKTALVDGTGTIIQGSWNMGNGRKGYVVRNFGLDVGRTWCAANNGGVQADGISVDNPGVLGGVTGLQMTDILVLGQDGAGVGHCISLQDVEGAILNNVTTWFGAHGIAFKGQHSNLSNLSMHGARLSGLILKNGDSTLKCEYVNVSNVVGTAQTISGTTYSASAIILNGVDATNPLWNININNVSAKGVPGVRFDIAAADGIRDIAVSNVSADGESALFFNTSGANVTRSVMAVNCVSTGTSNQGFAIQSVQDSTFVNCTASNKTTAGFLISGTNNANIQFVGSKVTNSARGFWNLSAYDVTFVNPPTLVSAGTNFTASGAGRFLGLAAINEQAVTQTGGTTTINLLNAIQTRFTATGNTTLALQNSMPGNTYTIAITQASGVAPFTIAGPTGSKFANGGTNHVMSGTNTIDVLSVRYFSGTIPLISLEKSFTP